MDDKATIAVVGGKTQAPEDAANIQNLIYVIRGKQVMTNTDIAIFNSQYPTLSVEKTQVFHDRFLVIDGITVYHIGASIKDAGKKCFGISLWQDPNIVADLLNRLKRI